MHSVSSRSHKRRLPNLRRRLRARSEGQGPVQTISRSRRPHFVHRRVDVVIPSLPDAFDGYRIIHLTDLHFGPAIAYRTVMAGIELTKRLEPDLIVLTGDFVTDRLDDLLPDALNRLTARDGIFAVLGNHDHWTDPEGVRRILVSSGVTELCNNSMCLIRDDQAIWLAGVDSIYLDKQDLCAALADVPSDATTILLAHEPDFGDEAAASGRIALQLSGHAHGGSFQIPGLGIPVLSHLLKHARKYPFGLYRPNGMWLYTSAGIGRGRLPRFNAAPEVTEITLWQRPVEMADPVYVNDPAAVWGSPAPELAVS